MRGKQLLAAFLLGVGLCFLPVLGYGEVEHWAYEAKASYMKVFLLEACFLISLEQLCWKNLRSNWRLHIRA